MNLPGQIEDYWTNARSSPRVNLTVSLWGIPIRWKVSIIFDHLLTLLTFLRGLSSLHSSFIHPPPSSLIYLPSSFHLSPHSQSPLFVCTCLTLFLLFLSSISHSSPLFPLSFPAWGNSDRSSPFHHGSISSRPPPRPSLPSHSIVCKISHVWSMCLPSLGPFSWVVSGLISSLLLLS